MSCGVVTMATPVEVRQKALYIRNYRQAVTSYSLQLRDIFFKDTSKISVTIHIHIMPFV